MCGVVLLKGWLENSGYQELGSFNLASSHFPPNFDHEN